MAPKTTKSNARNQATDLLLKVLVHGQSLSRTLKDHRSLSDPRDHALIQELAFGVLRWLPRLECIASKLLRKPVRKRDIDIQVLLYIGLYQMLETRVPAHAAVSETVACASLRGKSWARGVLNASLRRFGNDQKIIERECAADDAYRYAHPRWLIEKIRNAWPNDWQTIIEANNQRPAMTLRVNRRRTSRASYIQMLEQAGMTTRTNPFLADAITLETPCGVEKLPGFAEGLVSVQDGGAQLAQQLLAVAPGDRVLDACAAPGGKSAHLLETDVAPGSLTAIDSDEKRLDRLRRGMSRLHLDAKTLCGRAEKPEQWWDGEPFNRILLDVPCSATGVIRRHPDIKILRRQDDLAALCALQSKMLDALWPLLAPDAQLLYATCSILPEENEQQVSTFLRANLDAVEQPICAEWGIKRDVGRQILPGSNAMDGFYYAVLRKQS